MAPVLSRPDRIKLAFDLGTTFSGAAYTYAGSPTAAADIVVITKWGGITSEKVPTELAYETATQGIKRSFGGQPINTPGRTTEKITWGFDLKPGQPRLRCLKLRLDPRQKLPSYVSKNALDGQLLLSGKTAEGAIADYLSLAFARVKDEMTKRLGEHMMKTTPIDVILTVPAVWSDAAKDATLRAAEKAGMGTNIGLISEPEAAAHYAIESVDNKKKILQVGDNIIVCDGGGGTVDLISYEVLSLSPLRLQESAPGSGALCGAVFLNLRFEELVKSRLGIDTFGQLPPKAWAGALSYFENYAKRAFDPKDSHDEYDDTKFEVPMTGVADNIAAGIEGSYFTLSAAEMAELYRPLVNSVIELIEKQRNLLAASGKTAKCVVMVGGFCQSNYLYRCLKTRFADDDPPPAYTQTASTPVPEYTNRFQVLQPDHPWTAVVRGAVLSSLEKNIVASRKATRHYGILCNEEWDRTKHSFKNKYWCDFSSSWHARNQICWHVKRGQTLKPDEPLLLRFGTHFECGEGYPSSTDSEIIVSDAPVAPQEFEETAETRILCTLEASLRGVPRKHFKKRTRSGVLYRQLDHQMGMTLESGGLVFDLRVDGRVHAKIRAKYE
ncbi:actin-like ATPase domain-containing protein [Aureobasidium sp. EXF-10728]|nr:actin-like ATPase domain-containing protein [Aureobasidium sp. EXF-10728]